ncbi:centrosomal protein of 170 kDa-like isoform X2 [Lineus longissimus]|uniref:centrosomal protein of 170 kDa-like isoform X2 n=1 Tax=Lineus longissimus TaxID=88925 RepID=UPI00315C9BDB
MASTSSTKETMWCLVDRNGTHYKLPQAMIFLGREECDIALKSRSVDKRHAVISFDHYENKFKVKDLSSLNGTFVNESRIPEQDYVNLDHMDTIRFGYDPMVYRIERIDESPQVERVEDLLTQKDKIPVWAKREETHAPAMAECRGCMAEQCIKHTCNADNSHEHMHSHVEHNHPPAEPAYSNSPGNYGSWPRSRHMKDLQMKPAVDRSYHQYTTYPDQEEVPRNPSPYQDSHNNPHTAATYHHRYNADPVYANQQMGFLPHLQQQIYQNIPTTITMTQSQLPRPSDYVNYNVTRLEEPPPNTAYREVNDPQYAQYQRDMRGVDTNKQPYAADLNQQTFSDGKQTYPAYPTDDTGNRAYSNGSAYPKSVDVRDLKELPSVLLPENQRKGSNASTPMTPDSIGGGRQDRRRSIPDTSTQDSPRKACNDVATGNSKDAEQTLTAEGEGLETVKKGTPLYGQPAWWGEDDADDYKYPHTASMKAKSPDASSAERPSSLKLDETSSSRPSDSGIEQSTDRSKPDERSMAFTIDLDDGVEGSGKKVGMNQSLSKFMPSKIRKSFKERGVKTQRSKDKGSEDPEQERLEDISESSKLDKKGLKRSGYLSDQHSTASEEEASAVCRSEAAAAKDKRLKVSKSTVSSKPPKSSPRQAKTKPLAKSKLKPASVKPVEAPKVVPVAAEVASNQDDKRVERKLSGSKQELPTEYSLYKEAKQFDLEQQENATKSKKTSGKVVSKKALVVDDTDNVSETGTYTVESESKQVEVEQARSEIDAIFGVDGEKLPRPAEEGLDDTDVSDENILDDDIGRLERERTKGVVDVGDSMDAMLGSAVDETYDEEKENYKVPVNQGEDENKKQFEADGSEPKWVRQWSAADGQRPASPVVDVSGRMATVIVTDADGGSKKPTSLDDLQIDSRTFTRKPRGTGRKLPTTPGGSTIPDPRFGDVSEPSTPMLRADDAGKSKLVTLSQSEPNTPNRYTAEWLQTASSNLLAASRVTGEKQGEKSAKESFNQMSLEQAAAGWSREVEIRLAHDKEKGHTVEYKTVQEKSMTNLSRDGERRSQDQQVYQETEFRRHFPEAAGIQPTVSPVSHGPSAIKSKGLPAFRAVKSDMRLSEQSSYQSEPIDEALRLDLDEESGRSLDTEILLKDTKDVMDMLEARVQAKRSPQVRRKKSQDYDSETDMSSMTGAVDYKDRAANKPQLGKSQSLSKSVELPTKKPWQQLSPKPQRKKSKGEMSVKEKVLRHLSGSQKMADYKRGSLPGNIDPSSMAQFRDGDSISEAGSMISGRSDTSEKSDLSHTASVGGFRRSGSKGKGAVPMSMTRPNRAFALRRARLGSCEDLASPRSETTVTSQSGSSTKRSSSTVGSSGNAVKKSGVGASTKDRNKARPTSASSATPRSNASLGTKIVQKSRDNSRSDQNFARNDGGRHSLRSTRSNSLQERDGTDLKALKSKLNASRSSTSLVVSGKSTGSGSVSQPNSRSSSPRTSAEKTAWERRKKYDPRRAVAEAKAKKQKDSKLPRSTSYEPPRESGRIRRDTYSSSNEDLSASLDSMREDVESDEDASTHSDTIAKASSELAKDLHALACSVEFPGQEVEAPSGVEFRTADLIDSMFQTSTFKSAFKAPLSHSPASTAASTTPTAIGRSQRSRTIRSAPPSSRSSQENKSYDTLMVSSIHQLSHKLRESTDRVIHKLKEYEQLSRSPSPVEDLLGDTTNSDLPAWKAANQDLAYILKNLRTVEHHVTVIDSTLFPELVTDRSSAVDISGSSGNLEMRKKVDKITEEIAAFKPIENPSRSSSWSSHKQKSYESENGDFNGEEYF